jgi:hypothetical protein
MGKVDEALRTERPRMTRLPVTPANCPRCGGRLARDNDSGRCAACQAAERNRLIAPPTVPASFWEHEPIRQALTERHLGRVIRAYRCHPYHGRQPLPQTTVARWLGITQAQLSRVENGPPMVHLDRLIHWAQLLHVPPPLLWFKLSDELADDPHHKADVKRRSVLAAGGAAVAGALVSRPAPVSDRGPVAIAGLSHTLLFGSGAPVSEPPTVKQLTARAVQAWQLRQQSRYDSLGAMLPVLIHDAQAAATSSSSTVQEKAARVLVHAHNSASSLLKRLGDTPLALLAADRAVQAARALDDPVLTAASLFRLANVLLAANRLDETKKLALDATNLVEPRHGRSGRSLATWGALLLTAVVAAARSGDHSEAWELMGEAKAASRLLGTDHADLYAIFGPTNVAIHGVQVAAELGDGKDAVRRGQHVEPDNLPSSLIERRGQFLIDLAKSYALTHDDQAAAATLIRAERIAPQELRHNGEARNLASDLLRRKASADVRDLAARVGVEP